MRMACPIVLTAAERRTLERWAGGGAAPQQVAVRARIILLAAAGMTNGGIAAQLGVGRQTVGRWRSRFARRRLRGLHRAARPASRTPTRRDALAPLIVERTTRTLPPDATHWTVRSLARELGTSPAMVHRVWKAEGLRPHVARGAGLAQAAGFDLRRVRAQLDRIASLRHGAPARPPAPPADTGQARRRAPQGPAPRLAEPLAPATLPMPPIL